MTSEVLIAFFATCLLLIATPGPDMLFVVSQSITRGKKYGIAATIGQVGGLLFHLLLFAFGISTLIMSSEIAYKGVKILGACYLFWLSYNIYKAPSAIVINEVGGKNTTFLGFMRQGLFMNILNPKVMMFFLALFPGFISETSGNISSQVLVLGAILIAQTLAIFISISIIASQLTDIIRNNNKIGLFLKWMQIVIFTGLGIFLLL